MAKRGADQQLTNLNYQDENQQEVVDDYFQVASSETLATRKIKPLRGKLPSTTPNINTERKETKAATAILNSIGSGFGASFIPSQASDKSIDQNSAENSNLAPKQNKNDREDKKENDKQKSELLGKIKNLNSSFLSQIGFHCDSDELVNLIPLCNDYIRYRSEIIGKLKGEAQKNKNVKLEQFAAPKMPENFEFGASNPLSSSFELKPSSVLPVVKPAEQPKPNFSQTSSPFSLKTAIPEKEQVATVINAPVPPASAKGFTFGGFGQQAEPKSEFKANEKPVIPSFKPFVPSMSQSQEKSDVPLRGTTAPKEKIDNPLSSAIVPQPTPLKELSSIFKPVEDTPSPFSKPNTLGESKAETKSSFATTFSDIKPAPTFNFGVPLSVPGAKAETKATVSGFSFGSQSPAKTISTPAPTPFSAPATTAIDKDTKAAPSPFAFGSAVNETKPPVFNFGSTVVASSKPTPAPVFNFTPTSISSDVKSAAAAAPAPFSFSFAGNSFGTGSASFGAPAPAVTPFQFSKNPEEKNDEEAAMPFEPQVGESLMTGEGEQDETTTFSVKARIRVQTDSGWEPIGVGMLKINTSKLDSKSRILLRADTNGRVLVNSRIFKGMSATKKDAKMCATTLQIDGSLKTCLISIKTEKDVDAFIQELKKLSNEAQ